MIAYIILIVVVGVLLLGVGGSMLLRPRGMHGVRRGRARELDLTGPHDVFAMVPGATVHLYGKGPPRPGRKMGHVTQVGAVPPKTV